MEAPRPRLLLKELQQFKCSNDQILTEIAAHWQKFTRDISPLSPAASFFFSNLPARDSGNSRLSEI